jgi:hypothetical protein
MEQFPLAKFAAQQADKFRKIELILLGGSGAKRLDLTDETVRKRVGGWVVFGDP